MITLPIDATIQAATGYDSEAAQRAAWGRLASGALWGGAAGALAAMLMDSEAPPAYAAGAGALFGAALALAALQLGQADPVQPMPGRRPAPSPQQTAAGGRALVPPDPDGPIAYTSPGVPYVAVDLSAFEYNYATDTVSPR